jgi:hypothetical protein
MEAPDPHKFDPALLAKTWWTTFNPNGTDAAYSSTQEVADLPAPVQAALRNFAPDRGKLGAADVNWNLTCIDSTGRNRLRKTAHLPGGSRSGSGCGEDALWATPKSVNEPGTPVAVGSAEFGYLGVIYLIDGGLCPCMRCCQSLIGLSKRTGSTIVVRPMTDYEIIATSRTKLDPIESYVLAFRPTDEAFMLYHSAAKEAPRNAAARDVTKDPTRAWFACNNTSCNLNYTVKFASSRQKLDEIKLGKLFGANREEYPVLRCPQCRTGTLDLVKSAKGSFPARSIDFG